MKKILLFLYLLHASFINADSPSFFDSYKTAGLAITALASGVGFGLSQWLKSDFDQQCAAAKAQLPQACAEDISAALHAKKKERGKLLVQQMRFTSIARLNEIIYRAHSHQQRPSKARRQRA